MFKGSRYLFQGPSFWGPKKPLVFGRGIKAPWMVGLLRGGCSRGGGNCSRGGGKIGVHLREDWGPLTTRPGTRDRILLLDGWGLNLRGLPSHRVGPAGGEPSKFGVTWVARLSPAENIHGFHWGLLSPRNK